MAPRAHAAHWELERQLHEHDEPAVRGFEVARMRRHMERRAHVVRALRDLGVEAGARPVDVENAIYDVLDRIDRRGHR